MRTERAATPDEALEHRPISTAPPPLNLYINGKFAAQHGTGVQRVASNLLGALDAHLASGKSGGVGRVILLLPPGAQAPALTCVEIKVVGIRGGPLHVWEQCHLPVAARHGLLLNLAGSAPILAHSQVCLIHDAAVFDSPGAYTRLFRGWYQTLFRLLAWRRVPMLTVSAFSQQRLASCLRISASRIAVVQNGGHHLQAVTPDLGALARYGLTPERYLLAVGSNNPNKNLVALQTAFCRLTAGPEGEACTGAKLVIVGSGNPRVFAAQATSNIDAVGIVHTGALDDAALKALYQHAAGLVFPSLYEGFGLPPLEAMSCGCPVAASNTAAIPQVCGDAALYFDPTSVEQMAQAMQALLHESGLRDRLRRAGARHVQAYTWPRAAENLLLQLHPQLASRTQASQLTPVAAGGQP
jgi:glycosyltransferase involved in cell wall biosynthesis